MPEAALAVVVEPVPRDAERDSAILDALGASLAAKRQKAIDHRVAHIDRRWFDDVEAYEGRDEVSRIYEGLRATVEGYVDSQDSQTQARSTLIVNVTRQKVNADAARTADIALPTDDRNWDLRPSTVPELVKQRTQKHIGLARNGTPIMVNDQGQQRQATMADLAQMTMDEARKAAVAMRDEIDDQLDLSADGCGWEGILRRIIFDRCLLGVGIAKGPIVTSRVKKVWMPISDGQKTLHVLSRIQDLKPMSSRVDPWDFYPHQDCGEDATKGAMTFERSRVTAADIRHMADLPGYLLPQLKKVLIEGPKRPGQSADKPGQQTIVDTDTIFEQWEIHGELDRESLLAAGCTCSDDDVFTSYSACVIMINDTVVKADFEILDTEELPYDIYVVDRVSGSWDGYGTSFMARSAQRAITAAWRMMMDNAGQSVGPQVVINRALLDPANEQWILRGMKLWWAKDREADIQKAFAIFNVPSHQAEYAEIIKTGMQFLDDETALPMLAQGEQGTATDVLGGMNLLLNASNVMMRRKLKALDDQVTIRHIGRYVDWNMQYNPKEEIKGDFEVQARASGALLDQEMQNKAAGGLLQLAANPMFAHGMKKWDSLRRVIKAWRFDPKEFVKTDEEIARAEEQMAKQPPQDPRIAIEQMRVQLEQLRMQFEERENDKDRQMKMAIEMIDSQLSSEELSSVERQVLEKLKVELAGTTMKLNVQRQLSAADIAHDKDLELAGHIVNVHKHRNPSAQVITPPTEPAGRARTGKAWQA